MPFNSDNKKGWQKIKRGPSFKISHPIREKLKLCTRGLVRFISLITRKNCLLQIELRFLTQP